MSSIELRPPLEEYAVRKLRVGDVITLTGAIVTARDRAHAYLAEADRRDELPFDLAGGLVYHCGPIARETESGLTVVSAGPTTSSRMNAYQAAVVERYGVRAIVGKGGMDEGLLKTFADLGCVYLSSYGGCGALYARHIRTVLRVFKAEEFGSPEAFWVLDVDSFPALVTMDTKGGNLHAEVRRRSKERAGRLQKP